MGENKVVKEIDMNKKGKVIGGDSVVLNDKEGTVELETMSMPVNIEQTAGGGGGMEQGGVGGRDEQGPGKLAMDSNVSTPSLVNQSQVTSTNCENNVGSSEMNKDEGANNNENNTYAKMLKKDVNNVHKELVYIAPNVNKDGEETVVFYEEIVQKGSMKWINTVCGYFVRQNMSIHELRYHIRRMWSRYGIKEITDNGNGMNLFKFRDEIGMNQVLSRGPWMVNSRPMFVQKWDPEIGMIKVEPVKLPVWVRLMKVPLESWSVKGISAIARKTNYARVLVEVEAGKELKNTVKIEYIDKNKNVKGSKEVQAEYEWKPERCSHCIVFGHSFDKCNARPITESEMKEKTAEEEKIRAKNTIQNDGFTEVQLKKRTMMQQKKNGQYRNYGPQVQRREYRKRDSGNGKGKKKVNEGTNTNKAGRSAYPTNSIGSGVNRYEVLSKDTTEERNDLRIMKDRMVVDEYLNKKIQPTCTELKDWTKDMEDYFKKQWEIDRIKEKEEGINNVEDVMEGVSEMAQTMASENVIGLSQAILN
ncbi:hypothetical protein CTI12_AA463630 [Artemisia annua]|uniref:DUF4283 domain-containing protein n=1 Tax=Artemisia annua TaxID=35608 RepID=A0A2U1LQW2_ARTAN|nr:hypothetical protein CTI12_AA463630 [Artemisia annua]